ncbi:MAG: hypothetical protein JW804_05255 [Sedimentisphaerales bacterium]|nr:hypothetical protein [Sedimentisphaerales bacterium]
MALRQKQHSKLQTIISVIIMVILIITAGTIFKMQQDFDLARFGIQPAAAEKPVSQKADIFADIKPDNFESSGPTETYSEDNLYNKINGKAPQYTESGFVKLTTQRFVSTENEELSFEIYLFDMGEIKNAFSVYGIQKRPDAKDIENLKFAYKTENALYFIKGKYYCEIVGSSDWPELLNAITKTAQLLTDNLKDAGPDEIPELALFPKENLIKGSIKLYLSSAFGCADLNNIFTAKYKIQGQTLTAFISQRKDNDSARQLFDKYQKFLVDNGGKIIKTQSDNPNITYVEIFGIHEMIVVRENFVFGIHEFEPGQPSIELFRLIYRNLPVKEADRHND